MKVLLTTDTFYPMVNGVVISTSNLYKQLRGKGHDVKILTLSSTREEKVDGDIYFVKSFGIKIYPGARIKSFFSNRIINEIIDWKPDIIHSQTEFSSMLISKKIVRNTGIPHVHTYHTMYEDYLKYLWNGRILTKGMAGKLTSILLNTMNAVIAPTEKVKNYLVDHGVEKNIYVIPTGIDISKFKVRLSEDEKRNLLSKYNIRYKNILVYIGRVAEEKNIEEIMNYFSKLSKVNKDICLMIVGGGPYLTNLKKLADDLELKDRIVFTGMISSNEIYKYYQLGDVFVMASTSETQGLTYIEALSSGVPVVCRNDACVKNLIVDGENGFKYENDEDFIKYINYVLSYNKTVHRMSNSAVKTAEEYSCEVFGDRINKVYMEVLSDNLGVQKNEKLVNL